MQSHQLHHATNKLSLQSQYLFPPTASNHKNLSQQQIEIDIFDTSKDNEPISKKTYIIKVQNNTSSKIQNKQEERIEYKILNSKDIQQNNKIKDQLSFQSIINIIIDSHKNQQINDEQTINKRRQLNLLLDIHSSSSKSGSEDECQLKSQEIDKILEMEAMYDLQKVQSVMKTQSNHQHQILRSRQVLVEQRERLKSMRKARKKSKGIAETLKYCKNVSPISNSKATQPSNQIIVQKQRNLSKNIKNYLGADSYYQQQIHKMINKFQKISSLKHKQKQIQKQLSKFHENQNLNDNYILVQDRPHTKNITKAKDKPNKRKKYSSLNEKFSKNLIKNFDNNIKQSFKKSIQVKRLSNTLEADDLQKERRSKQLINKQNYSTKSNHSNQVDKSSLQGKSKDEDIYENDSINLSNNKNYTIINRANIINNTFKTQRKKYTERIEHDQHKYKDYNELTLQIQKINRKIELLSEQKAENINKQVNLNNSIGKFYETDSKTTQFLQETIHKSHKKKPTLPPKYKSSKQTKLNQMNFDEQIKINNLKIPLPTIKFNLKKNSDENTIIQLGINLFEQLFRIIIKKYIRVLKKSLIINKYQDCIHYQTNICLQYHLICYYKQKIYFGECKKSNQGWDRHGYGYYFIQNKYAYLGDFNNNKKSGEGTINSFNGDIYHGKWTNGRKQGKGIMINSIGDIYKGDIFDGKKDGFGQQKLKNGDFYRGQFKEGRLQGQGTYWWVDGSHYHGAFKKGLLHGRGIWRSKQNDYYQGEYVNNKKYGQGIYRWSNGMIVTGFFTEDQQKPIPSISKSGKSINSLEKRSHSHKNQLKKQSP